MHWGPGGAALAAGVGGSGAKNPVVLVQGVPVGHARQVVANGAVQAVSREPLPGVLAHQVRVLQEVPEQLDQQAGRPAIGFMHLGIEIQVPVQVPADLLVPAAPLRAVPHQRPRLGPDVIGGLDPGGAEALLGGADDVLTCSSMITRMVK